MRILVMGARGFVGKNLVAQLYNIKDNKARWYTLPESIEAIYEYDFDSGCELLEHFCANCTIVVHVVEVNNPQPNELYRRTCIQSAKKMTELLKKYNNFCPIITGQVSKSSELSETERILLQFAKEYNCRYVDYRFHEMFGKWCEPNTFSEVSTACYIVANNRPVHFKDSSTKLTLNYIDDVVDELIETLADRPHMKDGFGFVPFSYQHSLKEVVDLLEVMDEDRTTLKVPNVSDSFIKALYSTYLSYLPDEKVSYDLEMKKDIRGSFTEFIKTSNHGQVSVNVSKPGIIKGQHWHNNRVEKFLVVSGRGLLQQRKVGRDKNGQLYPVYNSYVSSDKMEVVEVRPGFTHNLVNLSDTEDLVTIIWGNDCFDPNHPDTYSENV